MAIIEAAAREQKEEVMEHVADMIDGALVDKVGMTVDWNVLKETLSRSVVGTVDAGSRAKLVYEGCTVRRREKHHRELRGEGPVR